MRSGRQEADNLYNAPALPAYEEPQDTYQGAASSPEATDSNLAMLEKAVPGVPGEDYPIYAEVPESGFSCEGQVDGGNNRGRYCGPEVFFTFFTSMTTAVYFVIEQ